MGAAVINRNDSHLKPAEPPPTELGPVVEQGVPGGIPTQVIPARPVGRYEKAQVSFADAVQSAQQGDKYNLDDEIVAVRAQLSVLQERMLKFLDSMDDGKSVGAASVITRALESMLRRLGELLELSARMEGQVSILRVRAWAGNLMRIIREEAKDDELCRRIARRLGSSTI